MTKIDNRNQCEKIMREIANGIKKGRLAVVLKDSAKREYTILPEIVVFMYGFSQTEVAFAIGDNYSDEIDVGDLSKWFEKCNEYRKKAGWNEIPLREIHKFIEHTKWENPDEQKSFVMFENSMYYDKKMSYEVNTCEDIMKHSVLFVDCLTFEFGFTEDRECFATYIPDDECINCNVWED